MLPLTCPVMTDTRDQQSADGSVGVAGSTRPTVTHNSSSSGGGGGSGSGSGNTTSTANYYMITPLNTNTNDTSTTDHDNSPPNTPITPDETSSQTDVYVDAFDTTITEKRDPIQQGVVVTSAANTVNQTAGVSGVSSLNQACSAVSYAVLLKKDASTLSPAVVEYAQSDTSRNSSEKDLDQPGQLDCPSASSSLLSPSLNGADSREDLSRKSSFVSDIDQEGDKCDLNGELNKSVASTGSEGRKKRKPNWYSVLSPSYKSKCEDFKRLFKDIPSDERLMVDYSCALQRDILVHGRLYITQNWVCFYANIFRWETQICIKCRDITAMTKEKTARVIPNAIAICTKTEKYFFTSFGARDKTYLMLFRVWQNALMEQPMLPQEMWQWVHYSYGEELGLTSSDDDYIAPSSECDKASDTAHSPPDSSLDQLESRRQKASTPDEDIPPDLEQDVIQGAFDSPDNAELPTDQSDNTDTDEEVLCSGHDHSGLTTIDEVFDMTVDEMFNNLFTQSAFYINLQNAKKTLDLDLCDWTDEPDADGHIRRVISYTLTLNNPLGPKNSYVREVQTRSKHSKPGNLYIVDCEVNNSGVPYGDNFYVTNRFCLTRAGSQKCRLRVTCQIKYRKNVWGVVKNFIDKNVTQGLTEHFALLGNMLRKECSEKNGTVPLEQHVSQSSLKKRVRRRRRIMSELNQSPSRLPDVATVAGGRVHGELEPGHKYNVAGQVSSMAEGVTVYSNVESQLKIFSLVLLVLIVLNIVLYYNVCVLEMSVREGYPHSIPANVKLPESASEWRQLLEKQQRLHDAEIERWKDVLSSSILLVDQVKETLHRMRTSLDRAQVGATSQDDTNS